MPSAMFSKKRSMPVFAPAGRGGIDDLSDRDGYWCWSSYFFGSMVPMIASASWTASFTETAYFAASINAVLMPK